jgi:hypothetical protein
VDAWKIPVNLVFEVFELVKDYTKVEMYALTFQPKRPVNSVPANIDTKLACYHEKSNLK